MLKSLWVHPHLSLNLHAKYKEPPLYGSLDILFTGLFRYKMPVSEKGEYLKRKL